MASKDTPKEDKTKKGKTPKKTKEDILSSSDEDSSSEDEKELTEENIRVASAQEIQRLRALELDEILASLYCYILNNNPMFPRHYLKKKNASKKCGDCEMIGHHMIKNKKGILVCPLRKYPVEREDIIEEMKKQMRSMILKGYFNLPTPTATPK